MTARQGRRSAPNQRVVDAGFAAVVRGLCEAVAAGRELEPPAGGALARLLSDAAPSVREAVPRLAERWFGPPPAIADGQAWPPVLNDERLPESAKFSSILVYHCGQRRPWMALSTNESTFYRYRRAAFAAFVDRCWDEITNRRIPTNLPWPDYGRFIGRAEELKQVVRCLSETASGITGIEGPGGTGKTAFAQAVTRLCLDAAREWRPVSLDGGATLPLFDAVVWAGNRDGRLSLDDLLDLLARTLDYPGLLGRELSGQRSALRELLQRRPALVVLDDADRSDPTVSDFLLQLPAPSRVLLTSRRRLPPRIRAVYLGPLSTEESLALLRNEGRRQAMDLLVEAPEGSLKPLAAATRRFPLLAVWAAGQLHQGQTIERVQARLDAGEGKVFEEMFAGSVEALSGDALHVLRILPLFVSPAHRDAIVSAAAATANPESGVDELLEASLLEATEGLTESERRYALHPIPRAFVRRKLPLTDRPRSLAVLHAAHYYRELAVRFGGSARRWSGFDRIEVEVENILGISEVAWKEALAAGDDPPAAAFYEVVVDLAHHLRNFFWLRCYPREGLEFFHRAIEAARRLGDRRSEGRSTYSLAYLHYELGTAGYREARLLASEAIDILRAAGDLRGAGHAMRLLGRAARERGNFDVAWRTLEESYALLARHGSGDDLAIVRASQADLLRRRGGLEQAASYYTEVLESPLEDPGTRATVLCQLGDVRMRQGDIDLAERLLQRAEEVAGTARVRGVVAQCRWGLAQIARQRGDERLASALASDASALFERLGEPNPSAALFSPGFESAT